MIYDVETALRLRIAEDIERILPGDEEADRVVEELIARREVARSVLKRKAGE